MSIFRLSNAIFSLGLTAPEIAVYAYLCSLPGSVYSLQDDIVVSVKQRTIAANCGIKSPVTVSGIIEQLRQKRLISVLERNSVRGRKGAYCYAVTKQQTETAYFTVDRRVFGMLVPRQMLVYLFLCKSFSTVLHDCWNSYSDIAEQIGMKRETVVQTVRELVGLGLIVRMQRKSRQNRHVYTDNHYSIVRFESGHIRSRMPGTGCVNISTPVIRESFAAQQRRIAFLSGGSPSNASLFIYTQFIIQIEKENLCLSVLAFLFCVFRKMRNAGEHSTVQSGLPFSDL